MKKKKYKNIVINKGRLLIHVEKNKNSKRNIFTMLKYNFHGIKFMFMFKHVKKENVKRKLTSHFSEMLKKSCSL